MRPALILWRDTTSTGDTWKSYSDLPTEAGKAHTLGWAEVSNTSGDVRAVGTIMSFSENGEDDGRPRVGQDFFIPGGCVEEIHWLKSKELNKLSFPACTSEDFSGAD